jgi:catechol 2,3-dioxygenase-like lactoylglutathione lyase family enzyme
VADVPSIAGVYETVLYGEDVVVLAAFYADVLGLRVVQGPDELSAALRLPDGGMLLLFDPRLAGLPGRPVPSHGATGAGHVAFRVPPGNLAGWRGALTNLGVELEKEVAWANGGTSLYIRDPAGNSVELTENEIWPA